MAATQWLKTCSQCQEGIRYVCEKCQGGFCEKCVYEHVDGLRHVQHSIALYRYKNSNMVIPSCSKHPIYKLDTFCRECSVPLCLKCWTSSRTHASHTFGYMKEFIDMRKKEILSESINLQSVIIPKLLNESISLEIKVTDAENEFDDALKKRDRIKYIIVDDVNKAFTELQKRINKKMENMLSKFRNQADQAKDARSKALHRNHSVVQLHDDDNLLKIINYKKDDETYFTVPCNQSEVHDDADYPIVVHGKFLNLVQDVHNDAFGSLAIDIHYNSEEGTVIHDGPGLLNKALVIKTIETQKRNIFRFVYRRSGLWINDHKSSMISHLDLYGCSPEKTSNVIMCPKHLVPQDLTIIDNVIFYSCGREGVFIVEKGESKLFLSLSGWCTEGLCVTSTNELLVCISNSVLEEVKIIRCDPLRIKSETMITQEIQFNGDQPLFHFGQNGHFVAENKNGDICVSDTNADAVIAVNKLGKFRFKYQGKVILGKMLFMPDQIITDSLSNIIVTDYMNNCLHILDQNGLYLKCVDSCGLDIPVPLDMDDNGDLLVGMYLTGQIKVIRYVKC